MPQNGQPDAVQFLRDQHDTVRQLLAAVGEASGQARDEIFRPLVRLLAVHETAEEMVVYPAIRSLGDEGREVADARRLEEDQAKKALADLERVDPASTDFEAPFRQLRHAVEAHATSEEREVFPLLERLDEKRRQRITSGLKMAERIAPTHPHKLAPSGALGNLLVGPMVSMVDRFRDAVAVSTR